MTISTKDSPTARNELRDDPINYAKVVVLGASGVGKTAIVKVTVLALFAKIKHKQKETFESPLPLMLLSS